LFKKSGIKIYDSIKAVTDKGHLGLEKINSYTEQICQRKQLKKSIDYRQQEAKS
jgi:hypothetical protein